MSGTAPTGGGTELGIDRILWQSPARHLGASDLRNLAAALDDLTRIRQQLGVEIRTTYDSTGCLTIADHDIRVHWQDDDNGGSYTAEWPSPS